MYIPEFNRIDDKATVLAFMRDNPFAIVVSNNEGVPFATHIPVLVREQRDEILLIGHMAKANPHWKQFEREPEALVIFHGPHAYISPRWYENAESVPTWNYAAVHVYGHAVMVSDVQRPLEILLETLREFDGAYIDQWNTLREKYRSGMLKQIVAFEITVERMEAKFKLSQNRPKRDQANVIEQLEQSTDSAAREVAQLMKERGLGS